MSRLDRGVEGFHAGQLLLAREGDEQDRVRRGNADRHDRAHQRGHAEGRIGDVEHRDDAAEGRRQRQDDDERIAESLIVHDHQQVDEYGGEQQADAMLRKASFMLSIWPVTWIVLPGVSSFLSSARSC